MGHLTNPIGFRMGRSQYWKSIWASSPYFYAAMSNYVGVLNLYFKFFFGQFLTTKLYNTGLVYSHAWVRFKLNRLSVTVFLYSGDLVKAQQRRFIKFLGFLDKKSRVSIKKNKFFKKGKNMSVKKKYDYKKGKKSN